MGLEQSEKTEYRLEDIWQEQGIQIMQEDYAKLSGTSIWMLDQDEKSVWAHSIVSQYPEEKDVPQLAASISKDMDCTVQKYQDGMLLLNKCQICVGEDVMGYVVVTQYVSSVDDDTQKAFVKRAYFYTNMFKKLVIGSLENHRLEYLLNEAHVEEMMIEQEKARLQYTNDYDEMTQVHSRAYFYRCMAEADEQEDLLPVSIIVGDVNNLKFTNDMFGHRHGDWLLTKIAQVLKEEAEAVGKETGSHIIVARCGGDEFCILMHNAKRAVANYYCHRVNERLKGETSCCLPPSISLGGAKKSEMSQSLFRLMETADAKMYSEKREFKEKIDMFAEIMETLFARRFLTREELDQKVEMVLDFANSLQWESCRVENCANLMRYQDIGLVVVPEWLYRKSDNYTELEWREIKKHPQLGMKLALTRTDIEPISDMMYLTHENYDGSGWPRRVSGDGIAPEVTVVRLVTEYVDKMYKDNEEAAYNFVIANKGIIFEPNLTDRFLQFIDNRRC